MLNCIQAGPTGCSPHSTARVSASIYDGDRLAPGMRLAGPAVIERMGDTILLPSFATAAVDGFGNVVLTLELQRK